jgi:hypothetical protein
MRYFDAGVGDSWYPRVMGTYEIELRDALARVSRGKFLHVFNAGAADGYYAVGLATLIPGGRVLAFESVDALHGRITQLAAMNNCSDRVATLGRCDPATLQAELTHTGAGNTLIVMDVEGAEWELLDPTTVPLLRYCTILVELHEHLRPRLKDVLRRRFELTHAVEEYRQRRRTKQDLPVRSVLLNYWLLSLTNEGRIAEHTDWSMLWPKVCKAVGDHSP